MNYKQILAHVLHEGVAKDDRTGTGTRAVTGLMYKHDMAHGFPLVTLRKIPFRLARVELEGFIKGITDKRWYQHRGCRIWDEWCNPQVVPYGHDKELKQRALEENDLGPIYGFQWRHFGAHYIDGMPEVMEVALQGQTHINAVDQLAQALEDLQTKPHSRRILISSWNPLQLYQMAIPSCVFNYQFTVVQGRLNLIASLRSSDVVLGLPFDIAEAALLLHLMARHLELQEGSLVAFLADAHIYNTHIKGVQQLLRREPYPYPKVITTTDSIWDWDHTKTRTFGYHHHEAMSFPIAV